MKQALLDELIETAIAPIANFDLSGNQLNVRIVKPDTSNPELEKIQRGVKFTANVESENIVQNLEYFGIQIDDDLRSRIIKDINGTATLQPSSKASATKEVKAVVKDRNGRPFNPAIHAVDESGNPIVTKYKLFEKKA
jgi:hypothetical protein